MEIQIKLEGEANKDTWMRSHGFSTDEPLDTRFWESQPAKKIGATALGFSKSLLLNLEPGEHFVIYGVSAHSTTPWATRILADDRVLAEGPNSYGNYLSASFILLPSGRTMPRGPGPPGRIPFGFFENLRTGENLRTRIMSIFGR